ncbi:hypothetical protein REPUB_Repub17cG0188100 [Reevesia pubescens]
MILTFESTSRSSCTVAHNLAAQNFRFLAQDVVSWEIRRIGGSRNMDSQAMRILSRMREMGMKPSSSAMTILFELLLRVGDYGSVWKLFRDMIRKGPCPSNYNFNAMILGFHRKGHIRIAESLLNVMGEVQM